jgi:hypothetical protein
MLGRNLDVFGNELGMGNRTGGRGGFTDVNINEGAQYFNQASFFTFYFIHFVLFDNAVSSLFNLDYSVKDSSSYGRR